VFHIHLPPLRERREDIPRLAEHFLRVFAERMHKQIPGFTAQAMGLLQQYDWPGNVRELSNVVERLAILCAEGQVGRAHLRESLALPASAPDVPRTAAELNEARKECREQAVADIEKAFLLAALRRNGFNVTRAAEQTGMQRPNFQALLRKHNLRIKDLVADRGGAEQPDT